MSQSITLNGASFTMPDLGETNWGQNLTDYFVAIPGGVLQKTGGSFTLSAELDFGGSFGLKSLYYKSRTANPAAAGQIRLARADVISWRNEANGANIDLGVNSSDELTYGGTKVIISGAIVNADISASAAIAFSKMAALTASRALVSDGSGAIIVATTTATEIGYVNGVTSAIQTQLDARLPLAGGSMTGDIVMTNQTGIRFREQTGNGTNYLKFVAPDALTGDTTLKLPNGDGTASQFLQTDGAGNLVWANAAGAGTINTGTAGRLAIYVAATTLDDSVTLTNAIIVDIATHGQASTYTVPDTGSATANFVMTQGTQTIAGLKTFSSALTVSAASGNVLIVDTVALVVDGTNDRVGIGTASPGRALHIQKTSVGGAVTALIENVDNTNAASTAFLYVLTGGASAGDPKILISVAGTTEWAIGIDNSDSDNFKISASDTPGTGDVLILTTAGDLFTNGYTDYSATSTIVGWSSFTNKLIFYKRIGKLVWIWLYLAGTSNATSISFTLPYTSADTVIQRVAIYARDNGSDATQMGMASLSNNSATVNCYTSNAEAAWTNSGTKIVIGQFFYQAA